MINQRGNDYEPDNFTEEDVKRCLDNTGLKWKDGARYILSQCPFHEDVHPSAQIYKDDWFTNCNAGCGRQHITKAFPELRGQVVSGAGTQTNRRQQNKSGEKQVKYTEYELRDWWLEQPLIPRDHNFKNIPLEVLDELGWRWNEAKNSYFIPYWDANKHYIPFGQWRHLSGDRRFTFLKEAKPIAYGLWNLDNPKLFIVEGTSDAAVLEYCAVPYVAMPSAGSSAIVASLCKYAHESGLELVYGGDNDSAGDKLRDAMDDAGFGYRVKQPPKEYKDWGDFYVATDMQTVQTYCFGELFSAPIEPSYIDDVQAVFGSGAKVLKNVGPEESVVRSSNSLEPTKLL